MRMLEHKREILQSDIMCSEKRLRNINMMIAQHMEEYSTVNQQIKSLTPSGVLNRTDIYKGIRSQGALLMHQQFIIQKLTELNEQKTSQEHKLKQFFVTLKALDKKHYKFTYYFQSLRREAIRRDDNNYENEIQEMACYDRKKN